jgi:hypothetical protein
MARINVGRVIVGGIIAGVICFFGDGIVHGVLLKDRWAGIMTALGKSSADVGRQHPGYFLAYDLLKGPGPATALLAAITIWLLVIPTPIIGLLPMEFFSAKFAVLWSLYGLVPIIIGALIGAWIYREAA